MTQHKRKKNTRMRGSKTHGYGSMKKHRGAGHRGGRGNAGSGKRADSKKPTFWTTQSKASSQTHVGFNSVMRKEYVTINVGHLSSIADKLVADNKALAQSGVVNINLGELGIDKLLGNGVVKRKLNVTVAFAVPSAVSKVEAAGGKVIADVVVDKGAVLQARADKVAAERAKRKKPIAQAQAAAKKEKEKEE